MLPSEEAFAAACSALGIENKDGVVVYDGKGIFSAARVWWWVTDLMSLSFLPLLNTFFLRCYQINEHLFLSKQDV